MVYVQKSLLIKGEKGNTNFAKVPTVVLFIIIYYILSQYTGLFIYLFICYPHIFKNQTKGHFQNLKLKEYILLGYRQAPISD